MSLGKVDSIYPIELGIGGDWSFRPGQDERMAEEVAELPRDKFWGVSIRKIEEKRPKDMNNAYWPRLTILADHFRLTKEKMHDIIMIRLGYCDVVQVAGIPEYRRWSSAKLGPGEFQMMFKEQDIVAGIENQKLPIDRQIDLNIKKLRN